MKANSIFTAATAALALCALASCSTMQMGSRSAKTAGTGSAGGANSQGANKALAHCPKSLGTIALAENTSAPWYQILSGQYHLGSTVPVIKLMIQQSNCFVIVDRGRGMNSMMRERALAQTGELRTRSHMGKGQMVAADFTLVPSVTFSNQNAGGAGALVGGLLGPVGAALGGSLHAKSASTMLILDDNRSGVQLAAAEGSAKNWDFGAVGGLFAGLGGGVGGGYANTAQGKVIVAAFMDSYNGIVAAVRNYKAQHVAGGLGTGGHLAVQGGGSAHAQMSVLEAQKALNARGFDVGTPDGKIGPHTRQAIRQFQRSQRLPVTGRLDQDTMDALQS